MAGCRDSIVAMLPGDSVGIEAKLEGRRGTASRPVFAGADARRAGGEATLRAAGGPPERRLRYRRVTSARGHLLPQTTSEHRSRRRDVQGRCLAAQPLTTSPRRQSNLSWQSSGREASPATIERPGTAPGTACKIGAGGMLRELALDFFFPPRCGGCQARGLVLRTVPRRPAPGPAPCVHGVWPADVCPAMSAVCRGRPDTRRAGRGGGPFGAGAGGGAPHEVPRQAADRRGPGRGWAAVRRAFEPGAVLEAGTSRTAPGGGSAATTRPRVLAAALGREMGLACGPGLERLRETAPRWAGRGTITGSRCSTPSDGHRAAPPLGGCSSMTSSPPARR